MPLNNTTELEDELRGTGDEYTDINLDRYLRQANQKLAGMVGTQFIDTQKIRYEDQETVQLSFNNIEKFDKIIDPDDNSLVDASNYTVDDSTGEVTFDSSYAEDNFHVGKKLEYRFTPSLFKVLEVKQAAELVESQETIVTSDEVKNTQVQRREETIKNLMLDINSRNSGGVQRGDNKNRGSRVPDRYPE